MAECANCGRTIGKLEAPIDWRGNVVCAECFERLAKVSVLPPVALENTIPLEECPACSKMVSPSAKACPHCGAPINQHGPVWYFVQIIAGILIIYIVIETIRQINAWWEFNHLFGQ
jgi:predicted amidophosphoribosyltransferase